MNKDNKQPSHGPQLPHFLFLSPEEREKSPIWRTLRDMGQSLATIQKHLPQYMPEQLERLRTMLTQPRLPADAAKSVRRFQEWWREQSEAAQACEQPVNPPAESIERPAEPVEPVERSPGPGRPRRTAELSHLDEALDALGKKWPKARLPHSQIDKRHIKFVADFCRDRGDEIGRVYDEDGNVLDEALEQAIRRRIKDWKTRMTF